MEALRLRLPRAAFAGGFEPLPGLLAVLGLAGLGTWVHALFPPVSAVLVALLGGILVGNLIGTPAAWKAGTTLAVKRLLRAGIVLLGAGLSFAQVLGIGGGALAVIVACILISLGVAILAARLARLSRRMGILVGMGTAICGVSAIVATAPTIEAEEEVAFAVSVVTLFGMLAVVAYPLVGAWLALSQTFFGTWAGVAINDTAQTVAAGFIYGSRAGEVATVVKLTRTLFLAPLLVLLGAWTALSAGARGPRRGLRALTGQAARAFPAFVLGFLALALLRTAGLLPAPLGGALPEAGKFLIAMAIGGVGLSTRLAAMRLAGLRPLYVGLSAATVMAAVSFWLIRLVGV